MAIGGLHALMQWGPAAKGNRAQRSLQLCSGHVSDRRTPATMMASPWVTQQPSTNFCSAWTSQQQFCCWQLRFRTDIIRCKVDSNNPDTETMRCLDVSLGAESSKVLLSEKRKDAEQRVIFKNEKYRRKKFETFGNSDLAAPQAIWVTISGGGFQPSVFCKAPQEISKCSQGWEPLP